MKRLNRWVVVVRPKEPFYTWANSLKDDHPKLTPEEFIGDATILLIPDQEDLDAAETLVVAKFEPVFEHFLTLRVADPLVWPENRSIAMFNEWFEVEFHQNAIDLGSDRVKIRQV